MYPSNNIITVINEYKKCDNKNNKSQISRKLFNNDD